MKVMVLGGGISFERTVSLRSQAFCAAALEPRHDVIQVDYTGDALELLTTLRNVRPDCVLNVLHGGDGENGRVQAILELEGVRYTHSGVAASAVAFDKERTKNAYAAAGVPFARSCELSATNAHKIRSLKLPVIVKPIRDGSSRNIRLVKDYTVLEELAATSTESLMAEEFIPGAELTVGVMNDTVLPITHIIIAEQLYSYDDKYTDNKTRHILPAELPEDVYARCQAHALAAAQAIGCRGVSRTDFRWDQRLGVDGLFALETNTQPGMRPQALVVEQAMATGLDHAAFCEWIVQDASLNR